MSWVTILVFEFGNFSSFVPIWVVEFYHNDFFVFFSFVTIKIFEFCHNSSFWVCHNSSFKFCIYLSFCVRHHHIKARRNSWAKNLDDGNDNIYFCLKIWLFGNQFKPVWAETVEDYPARKLELFSPQNRYIGRQCGIWKIKGKAIFLVKGSLLILVPVKALETVEAGQKFLFFK